MPISQLDDGKYNTLSSVSIVASRATLAAQDVVATSSLSVGGAATFSAATVGFSAISVGAGAAIAPTIAFGSEVSLGLFRSAASVLAVSYGQFTTVAGSAILPPVAITSERSLGFFRSGASQLNLSYGWLTAPNFVSGNTLSVSQTTTSLVTQGAFYFSVLSLTSNGGEFGFRSGNTVYRFASVTVG